MGHQLLRNLEVQAAVQQGKQAQLAAADLSAARTLEELRRIAFADPAKPLSAATCCPWSGSATSWRAPSPASRSGAT